MVNFVFFQIVVSLSFIEGLTLEQTRLYETLTANDGGQLNGIIELRGDRFFCDETSLLEFVLLKKRYQVYDFVKNQDGLDSLYLVQTRTLDNLKHFNFPNNWRNKEEVKKFASLMNEYARRIFEREEYISCEILSSLLAIRQNELSTFDAFNFANKPYNLLLDQNKCESEFGNLTSRGKIFYEESPISAINLDKYREAYDSFMECIHSVYLSLIDFNARYSYLMSIREVETKLINLLNKGDFHLRNKFFTILQTINQMVRKLS